MIITTITGCIENKYDLTKEIDIKLGFGENGLTLPTGSTSKMKMNQIIELDKNSQLTTDWQGNYLFHKKGKSNKETIINIGLGSICNTIDTFFAYHFKQDPELESIPKYPEWNINEMHFTTNVHLNYAPDKMGEHVRALDYVDSPMAIAIDLLDNNIISFAPYISTIRYSVPSFYVLEDENDLIQLNVGTNKQNRHIIRCKGVDFNAALKNGENAYYDNKTGQIVFKGEVKLDCQIDYAYMDQYAMVADPYMNIRVIVESLITDRVTGRFEKSENVEIEPITFDDLPDFIKDKEVIIDIDNPIVKLTVDNEVPARALVNATLKAYKDRVETVRLNIGDAYGTDSIKFEGEKTQTVWISRKQTEIPDTVSENVIIDNIMELLQKMPDRIEIDGWAHTDSSQVVTMGLNHEYKVEPSYELVAPLIIGPNMKLVYTKEEHELYSKLKGLEITSLTLSAKVINSIPLDLTATLHAKDKDGNGINSIILTQNKKIQGQDTTNIVMTLTGTTEDFQKLDRLEIRVYAESCEALAGQALNENQDLQLEDIKITVQ